MELNHWALDWFPASLQPWVLGALTLVGLGFFLAALAPKLAVLRRALPENRFDRPAKRLG
ncbi:MAG: hypothetical protein GWN88_25400, partial [Nitrospinaceae bacterium]|nr:hypothetical protein [Nitrospinaceae bacterium]NIU47198.1 hypothetical protein [Nitrospinaceae bacterium]NIU99407.1 hypothetical protein [Nitrospinaceae bacterium]